MNSFIPNKKGMGALAQLAIVVLIIIIILTLVPAALATVLKIISAIG